MRSIIGYTTNVGIKKSVNQDSLLVKRAKTMQGEVILLAVCDGMGGLKKGELASATVVRAFSDWFERDLPEMMGSFSFAQVRTMWDTMLRQLNDKLMCYGAETGTQLGTTISAMLIMENGEYIIAHVGDSRVYKMSRSGIEQLTEDHSVVAQEVKLGRLTPEQAQTDPRKNVLLQCVGVNGKIDPDFYQGTVNLKDMYLLCSDGFRHKVSDEEIYAKAAKADMSTETAISVAMDQLVELNMQRGETDNISVVLCRMTE